MTLSDQGLDEGLRKYAHNTGYLFLEKVVRILVAVFVWALIAQFIGVEQFGILNFAISFVYLLGIISDLGLDHIVVRELVKKSYQTDRLLGTVLMMKLMGSACAAILIIAVTGLLSLDFDTRLIICLLSLRLIFQSFNVIDLYFQSQVLSKYVVYSQITALAVTTLLGLLFIHLKLALIYFAGIIVLEIAVTSASNIFYIMRYQDIFHWQFDASLGRKLLQDAWPVMVTGVAVAVYMRSDQIMIKAMLDATSLGYYAAATRLSEIFYFVPMVVTSSLFPAIINAKLKSKSLYESRLRALFSLLFGLAFILSLLTTLLARPIIAIFYGQEFMPAAPVLSIHIWASIFVFWGVARQSWIINENLQIYAMYYALLGALSNILLNLIFIPWYGIQGAAMATVFSYFIAAVVSNLLSQPTRDIFGIQIGSMNIMRSMQRLGVKEINAV